MDDSLASVARLSRPFVVRRRWDGQHHPSVEVVGRGLHIRFIVDKPKTAERLAAKKVKATAVGGAFAHS